VTSALTIGRFGLDTTNLGNIAASDIDGDVLSISGLLFASVADVKVMRQQLNGYINNPWEAWVPVTWTGDTSINGWYRVNSAKISAAPGSLADGWFSFSVTLERFPRGFGNVRVESVCSGANRFTGVGGVTPSTWHSYPATNTTGYDADGTVLVPTARQGPGGFAAIVTHATLFYDAAPKWSIPAANWYDMAATISAGSHVVVGRQTLANPADWELNNGLVKIAPNVSYLFDLFAPVFASPTGWGTGKGVKAGYFDGAAFQSIGVALSTSVLRNAPEEVAIRCVCALSPAGGGSTTVNVDISLRRGSRVASVRLSSLSAAFKLGLSFSAVTATTSLTGGIRKSTSDADGNRPLILSALNGVTKDNTNGIIYSSSAGPSNDMAVGHEVGGSSSAAPDQATDLRDQWFAAVHETATAVGA
jgi:hypothetical protein